MEFIQYIGYSIGGIFIMPFVLFALLLIIVCIPSMLFLAFRILKPLLIILAITISILVILDKGVFK